MNRRNELKIMLIRAGLSQSDIARAYGCTPQAVSQVLAGKSHSPGLQHYIAHKLGTTREALFGINTHQVA